MSVRLRLALLAFVLVAVSGGGVARADFTADQLVSGSTTAQADYGGQPAISADGNYVVFVGSYLGQQGIWRRDLQSGALDLVAGGDASAPSVSDDGRYVSFTTTDGKLVDGSGAPTCPSVWVRDMSIPIVGGVALPGAFTLASALDRSSKSITYAGTGQASCPGGGAAAAPRVALSGNGQEVAFTVDATSNLTTGTTTLSTPPAQVAVRYLATHRTVLVSQTLTSIGAAHPQPVPDGAAVTDGSTGVDDQGGTHKFADPDSTAAISADGTTVAWQGIEIPRQTEASNQDAPPFHPFDYSEPLWRRIADGPSAPIRRVTGGDDPACGCAGPLDSFWINGSLPEFQAGSATGPWEGSLFAGSAPKGSTPFGLPNGAVPMEDMTPQLSADGRTVAILSTQPSTGQDPPCSGFGSCGTTETTNAFVVDMSDGLTRTQALTRLTQWASNTFGPNSLAGTLDDLAISPDGTRVAFTTVRTTFPWSPPALISPQLSPVSSEQLYVANLSDGTLEVGSLGYDGQPANGNVIAPSFSAGNGPIVFASEATNLVYGALSSEQGFEVFTTIQVRPPAVPAVSQIGPLPPNPMISPDWTISATATPQDDGSVVLDVSVPGAGSLTAQARASVPVALGRAALRSRHHRARAASARHRRPTHARHRGKVVAETVAHAGAPAGSEGVVTLRLVPPAHLRTLLSRVHGLYATIEVTFSAPGHPSLAESVPVDLKVLTAHSPRSRGHRRSR